MVSLNYIYNKSRIKSHIMNECTVLPSQTMKYIRVLYRAAGAAIAI